MNLTRTIIAAIAALIPLTSGAEDLKIQHLSDSHTLVRVESDERYVLLPVQESSAEARVTVLCDGIASKQIDVCLARDHTDYMVPLDLAPFAGRTVILDVVMQQGRESRRNAEDDLCWNQIRTAPTFDRSNREAFRPIYHFSPDYGWMNDPNGMVYLDGKWHIFFQHNQYGSIWGNISWGHAVSDDLVRWEQVADAIEPDGLGAIFSGSAVVDEQNVSGFGRNAIVAMYTSAGVNQTQSIAWSNDGGRTFRKYSGNPVIVSDASDFRDPKMFYDGKTRQWKLVLAAGHEVQFYSSDNLRDWTYESSFGMAYGNHNGVWECPDLIRLPLGDKEKYVLIVNINPGGPFGGSATQYFIGSWDGHKFTCDDLSTTTRWMDYGKDHYATVTWSNAPHGRNVAIAWMSNWQYANAVPTMQFRSANSVPRDLSLIKVGKEILLKSTPSPEVEALRGDPIHKTVLSGSVRLFDEPRAAYEILLSFNAPRHGRVSFTLSNSKGENVPMYYDIDTRLFGMDRRKSGDTSFSAKFPAETMAPTLASGKVTLRLLVDKCSIEAFGDDFCMTNLVFPSAPYTDLDVESDVKVDMTVYPLHTLYP